VPDPVDIIVGQNVRTLRAKRRISQLELGEALGLTFQQIQKYEKGANRIGASRLQQISLILQAPISFFFEGVPASSGAGAGFAEADTLDYSTSLLSTSDGLALAKAFMRIENSKLRRRIVDLVEEMAGGRTA
jgi:transcriptional regulator with XRE-family HTH domain